MAKKKDLCANPKCRKPVDLKRDNWVLDPNGRWHWQCYDKALKAFWFQ